MTEEKLQQSLKMNQEIIFRNKILTQMDQAVSISDIKNFVSLFARSEPPFFEYDEKDELFLKDLLSQMKKHMVNRIEEKTEEFAQF